MTHRRDLGYWDEGSNLVDASFYADALGQAPRVLPPLAFRSRRFSQLEDEAIWTRDWVCIGSHEAIPKKGDLLPFTVGTHGIHVQRADGGIVARFNKAQHGGCRTVPLQCQTGAKTKCSFTSCGYSRDRGAIPAGELGDGTPQMHQYLGLRPERLLTANVRSWGPLIFVNLDLAPAWPDGELAALNQTGRFFGAHKPRRSDEIWLEYAANWKLMGQSLTAGVPVNTERDLWMSATTNLSDGTVARTAWLFPNLVLIGTQDSTVVLILQPTSMGQTQCRLSTYGADPCGALPFWREEIRRRAERAEAVHADLARWGTQHRPATIGVALPTQSDGPGAWMQVALAAHLARMPRDAFPQPLYQNPRS
ncbi:Rieske (2Fe-2S) protein [Xanthobacter aminoxidans]|uniref:ring-hydroxylating oxygenase subunit alpha n=1 Tax=Xanthobacter aminoxidans TaxID=186280 RepID=UPI002022D82E|nr:ring-hydroxylating oxygenase subunit alpha [Xanthobacter aminoxidans]MCL8385593.1 ring-hydroxylating oxygenase subunit alpha [Xanthobacter aminoxidans]